MWEFIKHKAAKIGCFAVIALMMVLATFVTRAILGWFHYDAASQEAISHQVGDYVGKGLFGLMVLGGFVLMGRQLFVELRGKKVTPPPIPAMPPPLPSESPSKRER